VIGASDYLVARCFRSGWVCGLGLRSGKVKSGSTFALEETSHFVQLVFGEEGSVPKDRPPASCVF
jgi:hypothetical protein